MSPKLRIDLLVAAHVVAGLLLASTTSPVATAFPISIFGLFPLLFAEAGLIGIWGGLSSIRLAFRLAAVMAATVYLWAVLVIAIREQEGLSVFLVFALTVVPTCLQAIITATTLLVFRSCGWRLVSAACKEVVAGNPFQANPLGS
ncbi:MAG TPA: hypothetical protein VGX78_09725 [Pirellulales bacterium]|jgi:hypothetical protein|nr:hypothetical protein [Pirellulales bacterium]